MRYYYLTLNTSTDEIEKNSTVRLKDYGYDNTVNAVNNYIYRTSSSGVGFFTYQVEGRTFHSVMVHDENKYTFDEAYDQITSTLADAFGIKKISNGPEEITMLQTVDYALEGRRREYVNLGGRLAENFNLLNYLYEDKNNFWSFDFEEKIIPITSDFSQSIYDKDFLAELANIRQHVNDTNYSGNIVHYIISSRSTEATIEMTETLMNALYESKRLASRRMEIISGIDCERFPATRCRIEDIIENNHGGAIVIDLKERLGRDPLGYGLVTEFLEGAVKRHRNDCLFVFTYDIDHPGYAYQLLPRLNNYVIPFTLREGKGDRAAAVRYLKSLIKKSEYAKYAKQAAEFMKLYPGNEFTQTDVLMAFEKFGPWCMNHNFLKSYNYNVSDSFSLDRDDDSASSYNKLQELIGLDKVKQQIDNVLASDIVEKERKKRFGNDYEGQSMHMVFSGNPGTAKTTVAKLFAGIAKDKGILKSGAFVSTSGPDLNYPFAGAVRRAFAAAKGGVLFIDEAYALTFDEPITALIQEMENRREEVIVILAGYDERMHKFMERNEGMKSRVPFWIDFPDYSTKELVDIFKLMAKERKLSITEDALKESEFIFDKVRYTDNFGNGRYVRNLIERAMQKQAVRLLQKREGSLKISSKELNLIRKEDICGLEDGLKDIRTPGKAKAELEEMIGLESAKDLINKAINYYKYNKACLEKGMTKERPCLHMAFTGNPGTAKSTVAKLFGEIMRDEKVLATGQFVELSRSSLVGQYVGHTAVLVKQKFKDANGGILFIDEAYSLLDDRENSYGDEAINTLVHEMENCINSTIVIFAGYTEPMKQFIERNPGMKSRIAFRVNFDDYSLDELCDIATLMAKKKGLTITDGAMKKLRANFESAMKEKGYGNGRYVRKCLEEAEMNMAVRIMDHDDSEITDEMMKTIEEADIAEVATSPVAAVSQIGFAC